jgi:hypothetical protein
MSAKQALELAAMSSSDASNRVLNEPLSGDEIADDAHAFSFPMLAGYRNRPEYGAVDQPA